MSGAATDSAGASRYNETRLLSLMGALQVNSGTGAPLDKTLKAKHFCYWG